MVKRLLHSGSVIYWIFKHCNGTLWYSRFCNFDMFRNFFKNSNSKCDVALSLTASSGTAISTNFATSTCSENFVKNSFKFDVALKHAQDEVPARKAPQKKQKSPLATNKHRRRLKRRPRRIQNTVLCQSLGDIPYYSKGNQCSRCSPEYPCGILCGN